MTDATPTGWWRDDAQPVRARARPRYDETREQMALMHWCRTVRYQDRPLIDDVYHYPAEGYRRYREAIRLQAMGVKAGVPDVQITIAAGGFHGLFIELKSAKGKLSDVQKAVCERLTERGYCVKVAYSWHEAARIICDYLDLPATVRPVDRLPAVQGCDTGTSGT